MRIELKTSRNTPRRHGPPHQKPSLELTCLPAARTAIFSEIWPRRHFSSTRIVADGDRSRGVPRRRGSRHRPTVLLEAMHAQTPVLMRDVNDLGRLVREADVGVSVPPADATVIAEGIRTLHDAPQGELERWGANGATAAADYRWGAVTNRILEVYRGVLR